MGVIESVLDGAVLSPETVQDIQSQLDRGAQWIEVQLAPSSDSARATKRLLAIGADDEPIGGDAW